MRPWRWNSGDDGLSEPVRCKRDQWYLVRVQLAGPEPRDRLQLAARFETRHGLETLRILAHRARGDAPATLTGWLQAPSDARQVRLCVRDARRDPIESVSLHAVADRDTKCHPLANVPRWSFYRPPFPLERIVLPASLESLAPRLPHAHVDILKSPRSTAELAKRIRRSACVLDAGWLADLDIRWPELQRLAAESWVVVDLEMAGALLLGAGLAEAPLLAHRSPHGLMSARMLYADVPTRGVALQDVLPYGTLGDDGAFHTRALRATRSWKQYADESGFATLLASETPWPRYSGHVLCAALGSAGGELIISDLPWIAAGRFGPCIAPRLSDHLLRMLLGGPIEDEIQYWNRWDESGIVVRDISEAPSRYPPLETARWAGNGLARLGLWTRPRPGTAPREMLLIATGRIDHAGIHDGLPPEAMTIFMKQLAREIREQTPWATAHLSDRIVAWQFDSAAGLKYAAHYRSAADMPGGVPTRVLRLRMAGGDDTPAANATVIGVSEGVHGDGSIEFQRELTRVIRPWIQSEPRP
ncbi:hypothetical protein RAS1_11230 [Phycisphaerae bacterium RAS1]|nr:hypothetical protein RAS1_11230 [Phycisphaerae bacterium RAS1]